MKRTLAVLGVLLVCVGCGSEDDRELLGAETDQVGGHHEGDVGADGGSDAADENHAPCNFAFDPERCNTEAPTNNSQNNGTVDPTPDAGGEPTPDAGGEPTPDAGTPSVDPPVCGDGVVEGGEACDDGNTTTEACAYGQTSCTVCDATCKSVAGRTSYCGDGAVQQGEECDDRGTAAGDGCSATCKVENGYQCSGAPSACAPKPSTGTGDAQCESTYGSGVYDFFPGNNGSYPKGSTAQYAWPGDDFESYSHDEIIESSSTKSRQSHLEVTSGTLRAKHLNGTRLWKRGYTDTYNFRVLSRATSGGSKVRFTDLDARVRVYISRWDSSGPQWSGAHIFARYQTENDLYVASLRKDGKVYIKRKHCDVYTTLAGANFSQGATKIGTWYDLRFEVVGQRLRFYVNGNLELEAFDNTLSWGTTGVRTDYGAYYFDDWKHE